MVLNRKSQTNKSIFLTKIAKALSWKWFPFLGFCIFLLSFYRVHQLQRRTTLRNRYIKQLNINGLRPKVIPDRHLFPSLYPIKNVVTATDIERGHKWKTYLLPLSPKFHEFAFLKYKAKSKKNFITNYFDADEADSVGFQEIDHEAEVVIFQKLLASLNFVDDMNDADLVLVPALPVTYANLRCRNYGACALKWYHELFTSIDSLKSQSNQKYLFLATQDSTENYKSYIDMARNPLNLLVTLGPSGLVVPSLNTMKSLQPKFYEGCIPLEHRSVFLLSNQGLREWLYDRYSINKELDSYKGEKIVSRSSNGQTSLFETQNSIFTMCAPGDLPFQKRFFDAILMCSIPVVIRRDTTRPGGSKAYWSNVEFRYFRREDSFSVEESYPVVDFPYSDIVVEVDGDIIEKGGLMKFLESIPVEVIEMKLKKISEVRNNFVYDLDGTTEDAFSNVLKEIEKQINV